MKLFNVYRTGGNIFTKKKDIITKKKVIEETATPEDLTGANVFQETIKRPSKNGMRGVKTNNIKFMIK